MADLGSVLGNFDAKQVEPNPGFDALPEGEYEVCFTDSKIEATKSGNGRMLTLEMQVLRGPHVNRKLWDRLNIDNPNSKAVEIARGTLSAICRAVDVLTPKDSSELHGKPLLAVVKIERTAEYGERNVVRGYKPVSKQAVTRKPVHETIPVAEEPDSIPF